jgi:5-methylcytosine-specific restriction protein A
MRGRALQRARARLFDESPLCVQCQADGRVSVAVIRDHIVPLAEGGTDDRANVQALCQACSDLKTQREAKRGMRRRFS